MWAQIIGAVIGGTAKLIDNILTRDRLHDELADEKEALQTQYLDAQAILEEQHDQNIANAEAEYQNSKAAKELEMQQAIESATASYNTNVKDANLNFESRKKEDYNKAKVSDDRETFNEWLYSTELNNQLNVLAKNQKMQVYDYNQASVSMGRNEGNALSSMASSGVRSSSMAQAIDLDKTANATQLQLAQDQARSQNLAGYNSLLLQNAQRNFGIQQTRDANNWLRNSYLEGGTNYNLYQNELQNLKNAYDLGISQINDKGNLYLSQLLSNKNRYVENETNMYRMQSTKNANIYEANMNKLQKAIDDNNDDLKWGLKNATAFISGGVAGWKTGDEVYKTGQQYFGW